MSRVMGLRQSILILVGASQSRVVDCNFTESFSLHVLYFALYPETHAVVAGNETVAPVEVVLSCDDLALITTQPYNATIQL